MCGRVRLATEFSDIKRRIKFTGAQRHRRILLTEGGRENYSSRSPAEQRLFRPPAQPCPETDLQPRQRGARGEGMTRHS